MAEAQQIIVELRIGNDAELLDGIANFHSLSPYICLDKFRGADWDAHASHAGDRNDIGRRVKNVIQACKGWVLVQLLTDELISAFQTNEEGVIIIYYSWNGGRAEAVCAGGKGVRMR